MTVTKIDTWANNQVEEDDMNDGHAHIWLRMIEQCGIDDFAGSNILDFGCNQGGFLRLLFSRKPYRKALGVDIAEKSLDDARRKTADDTPVRFAHAVVLDETSERFDYAFSHEVIYLLPDLSVHAEQISRVLEPGAHYFAAIGCYKENPLWDKWAEHIRSYSNVPVPDYSVNDYSQVFQNAGFDVSVKRLAPTGFTPLQSDDEPYFPTVTDKLMYHNEYKLFFRFTKRR